MNENEQKPGLVICDINAESNQEVLRFVSPEKLALTAAKIPRRDKSEVSDRSPRFSLELSPGSVRLTCFWPFSKGQTESQMARGKTKIYEWSAKSRAKMVQRLCSLDYLPMLGRPSRVPALITLTYPGEWEIVCPDGKTAAKHLRLFQKRYQSRFGEPLIGIWKREFQARGACHFHILAAPPVGEHFREWLSETWADIVAHPDPIQRRNHLLAGTGLDYNGGLRAFDPKRVAVYFSKHSSPNKDGDKEYQNRVPALWVEAGNVGRFWGYWGLKPLVENVPISNTDAVRVARILRKWARANTPPQRVEVWRLNKSEGTVRKRFITRRVKRFPRQLGFVSVNDGSAIGECLARFLTD